MRQLPLVSLFLFVSLFSFGQLKSPEMIEHHVYSVDELMTIGSKYGISKLESYTAPINILYVDSTQSKEIIAMEFKSSFLEKNSQSPKHYYFKTPFYTEYLVEYFGDKYAVQKLFDYYRSIPKFIKSDTIYGMLNSVDKYLAMFVEYGVKGMESRLKQDFKDWSNLSDKAVPKKYPTIEENCSRSSEESMKFKESDLYPDCNFISFKIAYALNLLKVPEFDKQFLEELKAKQTWTFINRYKFPKIEKRSYKTVLDRKEIPLTKSFQSIEELVSESSFETFFIKNTVDCCDANINIIIHDNKLTGFVGVDRNNGIEEFRIILNNKTLIVETVEWIIE